MNNYNKSDNIICQDIGYLQYRDKKYNDNIFIQQMNNNQKWCLRNIDDENKLFVKEKTNVLNLKCNYNKNNHKTYPLCPDMKYSDYLLYPCDITDYKNYLVYDDTKKCSKRHQALNNMTKRK